MNAFSRTAVAAVVAASLFGYLYLVESKKDPKTGEADGAKREKVFTGFDKLKARAFTLKKADGSVVRAEKRGDRWMLTSPIEVAADQGEIGMLLDSLQALETDDVVSEDSNDLAAYGFAPAKVAVSVTAEGAASAFEFELGDTVPASSSLFARVPGKRKLLTVSSLVENSLTKSAFDLRDRNLLRLRKDDVERIEVAEKGKVAFRLVRGAPGEDEWKVESPLATRAARWTVDSVLSLIENLRMESIVTEKATGTDLAAAGLGTGSRRVTLGLKGGQTFSLEIGARTADAKDYARETSSALIATIAQALADDLDKGLKNLRAARLLDVAAYEVNGFTVTAGGTTRVFTKSTSKGQDGMDALLWKGTAPAKDATAERVSEALFAVGGLDAAEFIDAPKTLATYGLETPALRVALRFDGGKKEDWFEVAVKDDAAFARRRDDTAILKLDKTKTEALIKSFTILGS